MCNRKVRLYSDEIFGCGNSNCELYKKPPEFCTLCGGKLVVHMTESVEDTFVLKDTAKAHVKSKNIELEIKNKIIDVKVYYIENKEDLDNIVRNVVGIAIPHISIAVSLLDIAHSLINLKDKKL